GFPSLGGSRSGPCARKGAEKRRYSVEMTLLSRFLMAVLRRPSVTTTAIVMTPRTTAYSAIVWPASSLTSAWRPRMKSDMYSPPPWIEGGVRDKDTCRFPPTIRQLQKFSKTQVRKITLSEEPGRRRAFRYRPRPW